MIDKVQGLELQKYIAVPKVRVVSSFGLDILLPALLVASILRSRVENCSWDPVIVGVTLKMLCF